MNAQECRSLRDRCEHETTAAMYEIAAQLSIMNERQERFENEWSHMLRPQIFELGKQLWPKLLGALDKASKGIFG